EIDIDWEGHLAHFTGDVVAHQIGSFVRKGLEFKNHAFWGGLVAAILFESAKHAFAYYLIRYNTYELLYGAFAPALTLLPYHVIIKLPHNIKQWKTQPRYFLQISI
ncbi:YihY/virulence factor BrkB family protein, partial [Legionella pneumophila]|uniref:YhjD/YihY/BrkB family envelope integrity protein n=1 Tax=Legionella pneumophila TaxID=446 RepID=UPI001FF87677